MDNNLDMNAVRDKIMEDIQEIYGNIDPAARKARWLVCLKDTHAQWCILHRTEGIIYAKGPRVALDQDSTSLLGLETLTTVLRSRREENMFMSPIIYADGVWWDPRIGSPFTHEEALAMPAEARADGTKPITAAAALTGTAEEQIASDAFTGLKDLTIAEMQIVIMENVRFVYKPKYGTSLEIVAAPAGPLGGQHPAFQALVMRNGAISVQSSHAFTLVAVYQNLLTQTAGIVRQHLTIMRAKSDGVTTPKNQARGHLDVVTGRWKEHYAAAPKR